MYELVAKEINNQNAYISESANAYNLCYVMSWKEGRNLREKVININPQGEYFHVKNNLCAVKPIPKAESWEGGKGRKTKKIRKQKGK